MKNNTSIKVYIFRSFIIGAILPIFILGTINLYFINTALTNDAISKNERIVITLSSKVSDFLEKYRNLIEYIGQICNSGIEKDLNDYSPYISYLKETNDIIESIYILDNRAKIILTHPFNDDLSDLDMSNQDYVRNLKDSVYWSSSFISYDTGFPALTISLKTKNYIIVGFLNLDELNSFVNMLSQKENEIVIITDQFGTIIAHNERTYVHQQVNIIDLQIPLKVQNHKINSGTFKQNNSSWFGSVSQIPEIGWQLYIIEPTADAFSVMTRLTFIFNFGLFLICLLMFIFSLILIKRISKPINILINATKKIEAGIYDFITNPIKISELNILGNTFDKMNQAVQTREKQLVKDKEIVQAKESLLQKTIKEKEIIMEQLMNAQKMEVIGTLAGGIAHDFNNILMIFFSNLDIMREKTTKDEPIRKYIDIMLSASERAATLIQQILFISRKAKINKSMVKLVPIVKEAVNFLRSSLPSNISIILDNNITDDSVYADPTQLHQIFMNLGTNAAQAITQRLGTITFHLSYSNLSRAPEEFPPQKHIVMEVKDTGSGIPPDIIDKIFDPFFTTKKRGQGTGLGLATVKTLIKQYNGTISVSSIPGKGSTFTILLPLVKEISVEERSQKFNAIPLTGKESILFVDDEIPLQKSTTEMFRQQGCKIDAFSDSKNALEAFKKNPAQYDILITDLSMPGLTGEELIQEVRKIREDIPVILCTGFLEKTKLTHLDNITILLKPFTFKKLSEEMQMILGINEY